jgi:8-oxo-dGTP pyrophosphatase MutT (NUDIX family)
MADPSAQGSQRLSEVVHSEIVAEEVETLAQRYGKPLVRAFSMQADDYIYSYRFRKDVDRRAEVVFAIQDQNSGRIWVHAKPHYPAHIFRLPSGGVHPAEAIEQALLREIDEETGLTIKVERFVGLVEYHFQRGDASVQFASYVFHLISPGGAPVIHAGETISEFRAVLPSQVAQIALDLRNLIGYRRGWGQWRALAHDVVYEYLTS